MPLFEVMPITCRRRNLRSNLEELIQLAKEDRIALMCAEAVPWRCHRSLIADALTGSRNSHRGHHESNSPPGSYAYTLRQSPRHHDHISGRGLTGYSKEALDQTFGTTANQSNLIHDKTHSSCRHSTKSIERSTIHRIVVFVSGSIPGSFLPLPLSLSLQSRLRGDNI